MPVKEFEIREPESGAKLVLIRHAIESAALVLKHLRLGEAG